MLAGCGGGESGVSLNDTGITFCAGAARGEDDPCASTEPWGRQDAHYGRDAKAVAGNLPKIGGGNAGFDFTKIGNDGSELPASATLGTAPSDWACTRDNVTGLIWEVKVNRPSSLRHRDHTYTWYDPKSPDGIPGLRGRGDCVGSVCDTTGFVQAVNREGLCGASDWRMPTWQELLGIVDFGRYGPAIDTNYFPNTPRAVHFWSGSPHAGSRAGAWAVHSNWTSADGLFRSRGESNSVRLVRDGP